MGCIKNAKSAYHACRFKRSMSKKIYLSIRILVVLFICASSQHSAKAQIKMGFAQSDKSFKYLALGDSYTIGESVSYENNFPNQLARKIADKTDNKVEVKIIATTGWTTSDLKNAISKESIDDTYDLVTLLIGVNNQYQGKPFSMYEKEFVDLLEIAISAAGGKSKNVVVVSIPDYAFTSFGQSREEPGRISKELDQYNDYAHEVAKKMQVPFVYITDITRKGLADKNLVASDNLHPSADCYSKIVERISDSPILKF